MPLRGAFVVHSGPYGLAARADLRRPRSSLPSGGGGDEGGYVLTSTPSATPNLCWGGLLAMDDGGCCPMEESHSAHFKHKLCVACQRREAVPLLPIRRQEDHDLGLRGRGDL